MWRRSRLWLHQLHHGIEFDRITTNFDGLGCLWLGQSVIVESVCAWHYCVRALPTRPLTVTTVQAAVTYLCGQPLDRPGWHLQLCGRLGLRGGIQTFWELCLPTYPLLESGHRHELVL